jgi:hypothetical protein
MRRAILCISLLCLASCPPPPPPTGPTPPPPPPTGPTPPPPPAYSEGPESPGADVTTEPAAGRADGTACDSAADCASGICEGQGCGPGQGVCRPQNRQCTLDLRQYCGCDGQTFQGSGTCPKRRYSARGPCGDATPVPTAKAPAGAACNAASDCASGICEGQGCGPNQGVCAPARRMCTRDLRQYCGCDGQVFQSSGSCPGKRFSKRGPC